MRAHIITIGDEILIGQIVDTNSAFIAKSLDSIGIEIVQVSSIADDKQVILDTLAFAKANAELVLITGGLGPTKDDVTKHTFCEFFSDHLIQDDQVLQNIARIFNEYVKKPMLPANKSQAMVPAKATVLMNKYGTAPGMWMQDEETLFIAMPGVPYEMKHLMTDEVLPRLQKAYNRPVILHKTIHTYGKGESEIAEILKDWEDNLPSTIKFAYLPSLGRVRLRLSTKGADKKLLEDALAAQADSLTDLLGDIVVGYEEEESLEYALGKLMHKKGKTLALAESCTGGSIASVLVNIPGSSNYFKGGVVSYATETKVDVLGISQSLIDKHSVVSAEVAKAMALAAQAKFKSDYALSTTGNAGPAKGDSDAEVGTVYIGLAKPDGVESFSFNMGKHRERVITKTVNKAMELLQKEILKN